MSAAGKSRHHAGDAWPLKCAANRWPSGREPILDPLRLAATAAPQLRAVGRVTELRRDAATFAALAGADGRADQLLQWHADTVGDGLYLFARLGQFLRFALFQLLLDLFLQTAQFSGGHIRQIHHDSFLKSLKSPTTEIYYKRPIMLVLLMPYHPARRFKADDAHIQPDVTDDE